MLRCTAVSRLGPGCVVWGDASLRGGARRALCLLARPLWRVGCGDPGLHLLLHAGLPATEPREEEDVLGAAGAALPGAVRAGRGPGSGRATAPRYLRLLQRLRRYRALVGPVARQPLHAQSRSRALEVRNQRWFFHAFRNFDSLALWIWKCVDIHWGTTHSEESC